MSRSHPNPAARLLYLLAGGVLLLAGVALLVLPGPGLLLVLGGLLVLSHGFPALRRGLVPTLPLGDWATGSSLILSGLVLLGLLVFSYRRVRRLRLRNGTDG
ncbi:MAG: hypothetical protein L0H64_03065 [Pseudonocardia sp.]|nr:hypothetical protein [Pseudonocardia sp.]